MTPHGLGSRPVDKGGLVSPSRPTTARILRLRWTAAGIVTFCTASQLYSLGAYTVYSYAAFMRRPL